MQRLNELEAKLLQKRLSRRESEQLILTIREQHAVLTQIAEYINAMQAMKLAKHVIAKVFKRWSNESQRYDTCMVDD